jgi:hypothetical protein
LTDNLNGTWLAYWASQHGGDAPCFICGEAYSTYRTWVEGCVADGGTRCGEAGEEVTTCLISAHHPFWDLAIDFQAPFAKTKTRFSIICVS